jgi:hypothetical protein
LHFGSTNDKRADGPGGHPAARSVFFLATIQLEQDMTRLICLSIVGLLAVSLGAGSGCSPAGPPPSQQSINGAGGEAHHHPESYAEAVTQVEVLRTAIKEAMAAGDLEKADGPVHEIGHVLEHILEFAPKDVPGADQAAIKKAVAILFECFGQIDDKVHGSGGKSYDEVSARIDEAMATLTNAVPKEN